MTTSYVSKSRIDARDAKFAVDEIVATSIERNRRQHITGALIFTGEYFAQILEGDAADLASVMASILVDPRHGEIEIIEKRQVSRRHFGNWSLAYSGPSLFVGRHLARLRDVHAAPDRRGDARWLNRLLREFTDQNRAG